jgi:transposase
MARWKHRRRDAAILEARRREALALLATGLSQAAVARRLGVSRTAVSRWNSAFARQGSGALGARRRPGRRPFLTRVQQIALADLVARPRAPPDSGGTGWNLREVARAAERRWGVRYSRSGIWKLLGRRGIRWHPPARSAERADPTPEATRWTSAVGWAAGWRVTTLRANRRHYTHVRSR